MKFSADINFRHIAIEGVFRSRKTLLAHLLAQKIGGQLVLDQTANPYLRDFYNEREGAAFLAQPSSWPTATTSRPGCCSGTCSWTVSSAITFLKRTRFTPTRP